MPLHMTETEIQEMKERLFSSIVDQHMGAYADKIRIQHRYSRKDLIPTEWYTNEKGEIVIEVVEEEKTQ